MTLSNVTEKETAAKHLLDLGVRNVLLKGGHEDGDIKTDLLFYYDSDSLVTKMFSFETIVTKNTHGTGCTLSSAIASFIAKGFSVEESVAKAKQYVSDAIFHGADIVIGNGHGPVNHLFNPHKMIVL